MPVADDIRDTSQHGFNFDLLWACNNLRKVQMARTLTFIKKDRKMLFPYIFIREDGGRLTGSFGRYSAEPEEK